MDKENIVKKSKDHYKCEESNLSYIATFSEKHINTRYRGSDFEDLRQEKNKNSYRTPFMRDRDRIIHSEAFRRMANKTQVFHTPNLSEKYRTRLSHTMEVFQISRSLGSNFGLNLDLIEAIALGHDLGHTPFGHKGEIALNSILNGTDSLGGLLVSPNLGFKHNYQSVRLVDSLEDEYKDYRGLNLTWVVREGIFKHTKLAKEKNTYVTKDKISYESEFFDTDEFSATLEGQVVAIADEIAQMSHDVEDAILHKIISQKYFCEKHNDDLNNLKCARESFSCEEENPDAFARHLLRIFLMDVTNTLKDTIEQINGEENEIWEIKNNRRVLKRQLAKFSNIQIIKNIQEDYTNCLINSELISRTDCKAEYVIKKLFKAYLSSPKQIPHKWWIKYFDKTIENLNDGKLSLNGSYREILSKKYNAYKVNFPASANRYPMFDDREKLNQMFSSFKDILENWPSLKNAKESFLKSKSQEIRTFHPLIISDPKFIRYIADHIALMSDIQANEEFRNLYQVI